MISRRPHRGRRAPLIRTLLVGAVAVTGGIIGTGSANTSAAVASDDWLGVVNTYRQMSGQQPVTANATWSAEAQAHSCYMLQNDITHDELPGNPGYTPGGDTAGNSGNVAVSSSSAATARSHVELWMTGPFHAIGILRHNLRTSGFGLCVDETTPKWHSGGTLDVIRGIDYGIQRPSTPIVFPGNGATVPLHNFITESPNPLAMCGWTGTAGLPLIAMMPNEVTSATTSLTGPSGPIQTCALHKGNVSDGVAKSILGGDNAVVVMPRSDLADGTYTATVDTNNGQVTWSFTVDRDAPLQISPQNAPAPTVGAGDTSAATSEARFEPVSPFRLVDSRIKKGTTRLRAREVRSVSVAGADVAAVSANFVVVNPAGYGFLTAYNCTANRPEVSTLTYKSGDVIANQAVVPLDDGKICLYSLVDTDVVIDVNGYFDSDAASGFTPETPKRLFDSRANGQQALAAGEERVLKVAGSGLSAPGSATSVALNVTVDQPSESGFLRVYPCGSSSGAEISTINYAARDSRPNSVVVPVDSLGRVCFKSLAQTDVIVDYTGFFSDAEGLDFVALNPIRLFDSRSSLAALNATTNGTRVGAGQIVRIEIAGSRGIPADATAVSVNVTATEAGEGTFLTAYPCGDRPQTSTVNLLPWQGAAANGAMVKLSTSGDLCVYALQTVHIIVDINGIYR
jgi:hypothetical protein